MGLVPNPYASRYLEIRLENLRKSLSAYTTRSHSPNRLKRSSVPNHEDAGPRLVGGELGIFSKWTRHSNNLLTLFWGDTVHGDKVGCAFVECHAPVLAYPSIKILS